MEHSCLSQKKSLFFIYAPVSALSCKGAAQDPSPSVSDEAENRKAIEICSLDPSGGFESLNVFFLCFFVLCLSVSVCLFFQTLSGIFPEATGVDTC